MNDKIKACFPQWGTYAVAFRYLFENGFDVKYITPPPITKRTLTLGAKNSPDFVCTPFKYCMGCYLEALENGANCLMQIYGSCRLDYYGELSEQILRDMGYEFKFFNMSNIKWTSPRSILENMKVINPDLSLAKIAKALPTTIRIFETIDEFEDYIRHNVGFEDNEGELKGIYDEFLDKVNHTDDAKTFKELRKTYREKLHAVKTHKPEKTLKVGMVGDFYTVQEPFSNYFIEKELAKMGIEVYRSMNFTNSIIHSKYKESVKTAKKYSRFDLGATAYYTIAEALDFIKEGAAGIIQVKCFGCTPELNAIPILDNIGHDYKVPVLHFSFDTNTSETGVKTRLEAFYDMLEAHAK